MRIGLALPQFGPLADASRIAPFAAAAERLGYDSLWVGDRLLTPVTPSDPYPGRQQPYPPEFTTGLDPIVTLAVAAAATARIGLASSTVNVVQHNALLLGRALTSLDVLSAGRLTVGIGLGWMRDEYDAAGVDWHTRGARLDEMLDVWQAMWTTNPVRHDGRFFQLTETVMDLRPVRPGGPDLLFAGLNPAAMRRVGRRGAGWLAVQGLPAAYERMLWATAVHTAEQAGRDPARLRRVLRINVPAGVDPVAYCREETDRAAGAGTDEALLDLTFATRGVDEALDVAAALRG
ncbi:TIGR03619 family F420-dependent LLM class oxidoreductase [Micromonosporaceae bacterium Da 78-11]